VTKHECVVAHEAAVFAARSMIRAQAPALGFSSNACAELVIVVSELASNILKYGIKGTIEVSEVDDAERGKGIRIVASDETGPFDLDMAIPDGNDAAGKLDPLRLYGRRGIGAGLGAIVRFSDAIEMVPTDKGKRLCVTRYVRRGRRP
jgi:anti-sigma regulatory factor (Ser/Thr protein kinase)